MFIFGDSTLLASRSDMWRAVIDELDANDCLCLGVPISCAQHPTDVRVATRPGDIQTLAPDGQFIALVLSRWS